MVISPPPPCIQMILGRSGDELNFTAQLSGRSCEESEGGQPTIGPSSSVDGYKWECRQLEQDRAELPPLRL